MLFLSITPLKRGRHFDYWNQLLNMRMRVCYLGCHETGLWCYLVAHIENVFRPLQLSYCDLFTNSESYIYHPTMKITFFLVSTLWQVPNVSEEFATFIFRVKGGGNRYSETLVPVEQIIRRRIPDNSNLASRRENLKPHIIRVNRNSVNWNETCFTEITFTYRRIQLGRPMATCEGERVWERQDYFWERSLKYSQQR
jgi:hypothetical protein